MTDKKPLLTDEEIKGVLLSIDPEAKRLPPGWRDFARAVEAIVAERAVAAEREAMKPAIIKALQDNEREGHSYFLGANPGVSKDDYEDVAEEAVAIRARSEA